MFFFNVSRSLFAWTPRLKFSFTQRCPNSSARSKSNSSKTCSATSTPRSNQVSNCFLHVIVILGIVSCMYCSIVSRQEHQFYTVYPEGANHTSFSTSTPTESMTLIDALSLADRNAEVHLVQALSKFELSQKALATVKMLSAEEERLCEIEESSVLKVDLESARLGPALCMLSASVKELAAYMSSVPSAELNKEPLVKYNFPEIIQSLEALHKQELHIAIDRWKDIATALCKSVRAAIPTQWKEKALNDYDEKYVRSKLLQQSVLADLGSDYSHLNSWFKSLEKNDEICAAFQARWEEELKQCKATTAEAVDLTSAILSYNTMIFKYPQIKTPEHRRQAYKDVKKKIKTKLGKSTEIPEKIQERMLAAISGK